ncbi:MAG: MBL fold metallo-hydrolase [Planctomycetota bacterium]|nr:MBL fold metallo-hydrolase [Planctomycetota bacterium]
MSATPRQITVQFLGTGGYHPNDRRHTQCVLLPEVGLAFDCGTSAYRLPKYRQRDELTVVLSHAHLDHVVGLTFLLVPLIKQQFTRIRVLAAEEHLEAVERHLFAEPLFPVMPAFEFSRLPKFLNVDGGGVLTHTRLSHPGGSVGYRIDWPDRSLAYITDTTAGDGLDYCEFIRGVDLLVHECNFPDRMAQYAKPTGHSHTTPVVELAKRAGVGRLCLTHIDPQESGDDPIGLAAARAIFPRTDLAEDLMAVSLPARNFRESAT